MLPFWIDLRSLPLVEMIPSFLVGLAILATRASGLGGRL